MRAAVNTGEEITLGYGRAHLPGKRYVTRENVWRLVGSTRSIDAETTAAASRRGELSRAWREYYL